MPCLGAKYFLSNLYWEGIYTHFATPGINDIYFDKQIDKFKEITSDIDLNEIPIIHLASSFILQNHPKIDIANGVRMGTIIYGYDVSLSNYGSDIKSKLKKARDNYLINKNNISPVIRGNKLELKPAFRLITNVMEIRHIKKGEILGYSTNTIEKDTTIAILPIGYDSSIGTKTLGRYALINGKKYSAIGPMCMCMMFVSVDESVKVGDKVVLMGDELTLGYMSRLNDSHIQATLVNIGKELPKVYIKNGKEDKII